MIATQRRIPVARPLLDGNERLYVNDALDRGWITAGRFEAAFEQEFAAFCGTRHAVACSSGSAALHLALAALDCGPGDEVIVPALTFAATGFAVLQTGAKPVVVDVDPETWCIDPAAVARAVSRRTVAVVPVHLYGQPAEMTALRAIADDYELALVEDAAEAHGASYGGRRAGSLGDLGCFSFYGNKILTTGEGGMVTTDDGALADSLRRLRNSGMAPGKGYDHPHLGFNYRMSDLAAAVGLAQLERIDEFLTKRENVVGCYSEHLPQAATMQHVTIGGFAGWMVGVTVDRDANPVRRALLARRIETRSFFPPLNTLPPLLDGTDCPVAEDLYRRGIVLPTHAALTEDDVRYVCDALAEALDA